jgi:hypothetical protein
MSAARSGELEIVRGASTIARPALAQKSPERHGMSAFGDLKYPAVHDTRAQRARAGQRRHRCRLPSGRALPFLSDLRHNL